MRKKLLTTGCILSVFTLSCIGAAFYVGAGLGPEITDFQQTASIKRPGDFNAIDRTHLAGTGIFASAFAGLGWIRQNIYLGGEVNADITSDTFQSSNDEILHRNFSSTQYRMRNSFGVSALPGFFFTHTTLIYGRLGYANGNFQLITTDSSLANRDESLGGFRFGLGIKQAVTQHFAVRFECSHVNYQNVNLHTFDPVGNVTKNTRISPQTTQFEFGAVYNFA